MGLICSALQGSKVMARVTHPRRKMANTTDSPATVGGGLLSSSTTAASFTATPASATYSSEGYTTLNYSGLGGYSDDLNYTELWVDVWNVTEVNNVTERLNATVLLPYGYCDEWEAAQHKLFQVSCRELSIYLSDLKIHIFCFIYVHIILMHHSTRDFFRFDLSK